VDKLDFLSSLNVIFIAYSSLKNSSSKETKDKVHPT
jgi:hypothetical protein